MSKGPRLIARIALFAALVYVLSWGTSFLPNVNLAFFIAFSAGFLWGAGPGLMVGLLGMWLWTSFNPYGPATLPVMAAQVFGLAICGLIGGWYRKLRMPLSRRAGRSLMLVIAALLCTVAFYLPVTLVDAWVYQPFWPRFYTGLAWMGISLGANVLIFPLLFGAVRYLNDRENLESCAG
jgi:uncharacterized membrane protein